MDGPLVVAKDTKLLGKRLAGTAVAVFQNPAKGKVAHQLEELVL